MCCAEISVFNFEANIELGVAFCIGLDEHRRHAAISIVDAAVLMEDAAIPCWDAAILLCDAAVTRRQSADAAK